jgi:hypothetical protein
MFTGKKEAWIEELGQKLTFMEEAGETAQPAGEKETKAEEKKETKTEEKKEKKEMNLEDMTAAEKVALIKSIVKHSNSKLDDEEFADFMDKVSKIVDEYADEEEKED